jgi:hypothetical protein
VAKSLHDWTIKLFIRERERKKERERERYRETKKDREKEREKNSVEHNGQRERY